MFYPFLLIIGDFLALLGGFIVAGAGVARAAQPAGAMAEVIGELDKGFAVGPVGAAPSSPWWEEFQVETYLRYHGEKLAKRFDANSYLVISKAMDLHDLARGRSSLEQAIRGFEGPCLSVGVSSDMLYPAYQQRQIAEAFRASGNASEYTEIDSPHGHDAFLMELDQLGPVASDFLDRVV